MAKRKRSIKLSNGEFRLMTVLWEQGPLTLAQTYRMQAGSLGYTTIQTQLNRLVSKGAASRTKARPMKYRALIAPQEAGATLLQLLIDTVGGGSIIPLIRQLVAQANLSQADARQLKQMLDDATPKTKTKTFKRPPAKRNRKELS